MTFQKFVVKNIDNSFIYLTVFAIAMIATLTGSAVTIVAFMRWDLPLPDLRLIIVMAVVGSLPYVHYRMST